MENQFRNELFKKFEELHKLSDGCIKDKLLLFSYMAYSGLSHFSQLDLNLIRQHKFYNEEVELCLKMMERLSNIFYAEQKDAMVLKIND